MNLLAFLRATADQVFLASILSPFVNAGVLSTVYVARVSIVWLNQNLARSRLRYEVSKTVADSNPIIRLFQLQFRLRPTSSQMNNLRIFWHLFVKVSQSYNEPIDIH